MRVEDVQTPAYVYDLDEVRRSWTALAGAVPQPSTVYYSVKANPHPLVAAALRALGASAEVCSAGELDIAMEAGFRPEQVLYTGPGKTDAELAAAIKVGVTRFSVDSPNGLDRLDRLAAWHDVELSCLLRVNDDQPARGQRLTMTGVASPFGADTGWIESEPTRFAGRDRVRLAGLHLYMGSNLVAEDDMLAQFTQAVRTARRLRSVLGVEFDMLDLGGGFGAPYARGGELPRYPTLAPRLAELLDSEFEGWRQGAPRIVFESGRYLTATCGRLFVRALDVKRSHDRTVVVLESGINHLGGMSGLRRLPQLVPELLVVRPDPAPPVETLVAGPLCTPLDVWASRAALPEVVPGDLLVVPNVGAYGLTASLLAFLGHPTPTEIIVEGGRIRDVTRLVTRRERAAVGGEE